MSKVNKRDKQEKIIVAEINDFFLTFSELLWAHSSLPDRNKRGSSLSVTEHFIINYLGKESFASMSTLSGLIHVAPTTMTSIIDRLINRGLLERRRAQQDRRKILVNLSGKGKIFYRKYYYESLSVYTNFLSKLPDKGKLFGQNLREIKSNITLLKKYFKDNLSDDQKGKTINE